MIKPELLEILACPVCKADVNMGDKKLICVNCGREFPIVEKSKGLDVPIMLVDEEMKVWKEQKDGTSHGT